ncbi:N-acetylmuramic acid 6-phosphate etherase [Mycoplasmopsis felis]|uniref:N-acetylmuramic acid 6-phosphate etherase n=1 Tax=Mycoplasmopsis felis TaxID=33923 RepID=UPI002AF6CCCD|nr:N-acetylmuramic acid 6-phosphate etherase [Mycoplasmopsis felis]WQQ02712.1 N-acetylmuramic acid 6-phosphate etherase [Mycoplasmopsis felis]
MQNKKLDTLSDSELINIFDHSLIDVDLAYKNMSNEIINVVNKCVDSIKKGGRIFYVGAGSSGRIGMVDALDILPTFGEDNWFKYSMAGGDQAILKSLEGYEDDFDLGMVDAQNNNINENDLIIGLSASGNTKYVNGFFVYAKQKNAKTALLTNQTDGICFENTDIILYGNTGSEIIEGSTRLKAGTLQKIVLNTISSMTAIKLGKVYNNYMIDLTPINEKLVKRSIQILSEITNLNYNDALNLYNEGNQNIKLSAVMYLKKVDKITAQKLLKKYNYNLRELIE